MGAAGLLWMSHARTAKNQASIAIVMTLSHPALLDAKAGFLRAVEPLGLAIKEYNAEGNVAQANLIAQQIAADQSIVGIFAIGTLASQATVRAEHTRPIVIAAVSDAKAIADPLPNNLCGLSDGLDAHWQIKTLKKLLPSIKSVSLLYSPHETNSASAVKNLIQAAGHEGLKTYSVGVHDAQSIMTASLDACQKSDAVLIPLDNQLVAAMPAVIKPVNHLSCPIITSNESPIHQGATIAFGVDYRQSGHLAGLLMERIIKHKELPSSLGVKPPEVVSLYINKPALALKQITIAENLDLPVIIVDEVQP